MLTPAELRQIFRYDPDTGVLTWAVKISDKTMVGAPAGTYSHGYLVVAVRKVMYRVHRVAWAMVYGAWPDETADIDHINGNRADNRICNLRIATRAENIRNSRTRSNNKSGHKGVSWDKAKQAWMARIKATNGRIVHLGYFAAKHEAADAYRRAAPREHGAFARVE